MVVVNRMIPQAAHLVLAGRNPSVVRDPGSCREPGDEAIRRHRCGRDQRQSPRGSGDRHSDEYHERASYPGKLLVTVTLRRFRLMAEGRRELIIRRSQVQVLPAPQRKALAVPRR